MAEQKELPAFIGKFTQSLRNSHTSILVTSRNHVALDSQEFVRCGTHHQRNRVVS
jgi:hypothetical protein